MSEIHDDIIREEIFGKTNQVANFVTEPLLDRESTDREGHNVYRTAAFVTIRAAGERDCISVPANNDHKKQFRDSWLAYQERISRTSESSLQHLPTIDKAIVRTLHELGIHTVETLAGCPVAERVEVVEQSSDDNDAPEIPLPGILPTYLVKWQRIASMYLHLKQFALTGEKPRNKLEAVA